MGAVRLVAKASMRTARRRAARIVRSSVAPGYKYKQWTVRRKCGETCGPQLRGSFLRCRNWLLRIRSDRLQLIQVVLDARERLRLVRQFLLEGGRDARGLGIYLLPESDHLSIHGFDFPFDAIQVFCKVVRHCAGERRIEL